jgi:predicted XRE-type DNA-binding protein
VPRPKNNRETEGIRRMVHQHLQRRAMVQPPVVTDLHLDEDALSAFVEGRLSETESAPVVQHLVACGFCRRATAELVRLEAEVGTATESASPMEQEPGRIRKMLDDLASRVLPHTEGDAVFAYHAPAEDFKRKTDAAEEQTAKSEDEGEEKKPDSPEQ